MATLISKKIAGCKETRFTENELQDLRTAFDLIDANQDGRLNTNELSTMLNRLGINVEETTVKDLIRTASHSGKDLLDEAEFMLWVKQIQDLLPSDEEEDSSQHDLMAAFRVFDLDQNGYITRDELKSAMDTIGEPVTEQQITEFLAMADTDKDGKINYEEFARLLL